MTSANVNYVYLGLIGELDRPPVTPNATRQDTFTDRPKPKHNKRSGNG